LFPAKKIQCSTEVGYCSAGHNYVFALRRQLLAKAVTKGENKIYDK